VFYLRMNDLAQRVREARERKALSQSELARLLNVTPQTVQAIEAGKVRKPRIIIELARALGVSPDHLQAGIERGPIINAIRNLPVLGVVQAGSFRDVSLLDRGDQMDVETIPVANDPRFPHAKQYALLVAGDSMDKVFSEGEYVTCVNWPDCGLNFKPGMILHVDRIIGGNLVETTVKRFAIRDEKRWLDPDSHNPRHLPIEINGAEDTEILIRGLVIGSYKTIRY
jgi:transcriptional regulator with XRE-family HTH domain